MERLYDIYHSAAGGDGMSSENQHIADMLSQHYPPSQAALPTHSQKACVHALIIEHQHARSSHVFSMEALEAAT